jgi:hypothetical protein
VVHKEFLVKEMLVEMVAEILIGMVQVEEEVLELLVKVEPLLEVVRLVKDFLFLLTETQFFMQVAVVLELILEQIQQELWVA